MTAERHERRIRLEVNGESRSAVAEDRTLASDFLRSHLGLRGTRVGCEQGVCGACTILVDGRRANSCLLLAVAHEGEELTTIEGLGGAGGALHPLQAAFIAHDAFQCGYCTPGQICSAAGMLDEVERGWPSVVTDDLGAETIALDDREIRERMSGNLCRCAAYANIVPAIAEVARR